MTQNLYPHLQAICDLELALGNAVERVIDNPPLPLIVVFREPLHKTRIEADTAIAPPLHWSSAGGFAGYFHEDTRQSVQGPASTADATETAKSKLSPSLRAVYDLELSLGNSLDRVDEPAGGRCPLAIILKRPMHKARIESTLSLPSVVKWWESRDPHYPIQGGYTCEETCHTIAGPLK